MIETGGAVEPLRAPVFCICSHRHIAASLRLCMVQRGVDQCFADAAPARGVADKEVVKVHPPCAELQLHLRAERRIAMQAGRAFGDQECQPRRGAKAVSFQSGQRECGGVAVVGGKRMGQIEDHW